MEHLVGDRTDFEDGRRRIVTIGGVPIGVFAQDGELYAFRNVCPHQGGPVCEGLLIGRVDEEVDEIGRVGMMTFTDETHLVCPWHGVEFNIATGIAWSDPRLSLRRYETFEREGKVYVRVD